MATLAYTQVGIAGVAAPAAAATGGGDKVAPNDRGALLVTNGGGGSITVTIAVPGNTKYGQANPDVAVAVAAGATKLIGPLPADLADPSDGLIAISYSGVSSVSVGAVTI